MQRPSLGTKACLPGKNIWYGEDPYYIYYPADQYEDDLRNGVGSDVADLILNVKDVLVKNGAWNLTGAEQTFYDQLDKMNNDGYSNDIDRAKGTKTSAEVKAEASKFVQQHLERFKKDIKGRRAPSRSIESGRKRERRVPWWIGLISFDGTGLDGGGDAPPHALPPVEQQA